MTQHDRSGPLSTFCLTDIVGSTALWDSEPDAMSIALADHDALIADVVSKHGGQLIRSKGEGDSSFSVFEAPLSAISAAEELVRSLGSWSWPPGGLRVRVGIHCGQANPRAGDWFGSVVNRAARIRGLAASGGVLCSNATAALIRNDMEPGRHLVDTGEHKLMGLKEPERVWALSSPAVPIPRLIATPQQQVVEAPKTSFIGRVANLDEVLALVREHRLVTLVGGAGTGKTRLAREVASRAPLPAGARFVELADVRDPAAVSAAIFKEITLESGMADDGQQRLTDAQFLLVVDNCEHVVDAAAEAVSEVLTSTNQLHILATSRELLSLTAEIGCPVKPLGLPSAREVSLALAMQAPAVRLFLDRARAVRTDLTVSEADVPALIDIAFSLDGVPLAIELAAGGMASSGLRDLARSLPADLSSLVDPRRDIDKRHKSLQAALDWTYSSAPDDVRLVFRRLSTFARFRAKDAIAVVGDLGRSEQTEVVLRSLVSMSLVVMEDRDGEAAYRLLQPVRLYAKNLLRDDGEEELVRDRHAAYIYRTARQSGRHYFIDQASTVARLRFLAPDIDLALHRLFSADQGAEAAELISSLALYWYFNDQHTGRYWVDRAKENLTGLDDWHRTSLSFASGLMHHGGREVSRATTELSVAVDGYHRLGRQHAEAAARFWLGRALHMSGRPVAEFLAMFASALEMADEVGDPLLIAWCRIWLAGPSRAHPIMTSERAAELERVIEDARRSGVLHPIGEACATLGRWAFAEGDYSRARRFCDEAVATYRELDDRWQLVNQLFRRAEVALASDDLISTAIDVVEGTEIALEIGEEQSLAWAAALLFEYAHRTHEESIAEHLASAYHADQDRFKGAGGGEHMGTFGPPRPDHASIVVAQPLAEVCRSALMEMFS